MRSFIDNLKYESVKLISLSHEELSVLTDSVRDAHRSYLFSCDVTTLHNAFLRIEQIEKALAALNEGELTRIDENRSELIRNMQRETPLLKTSLESKYVALGGRSFRTLG
jgi:hypothetical protein